MLISIGLYIFNVCVRPLDWECAELPSSAVVQWCVVQVVRHLNIADIFRPVASLNN